MRKALTSTVMIAVGVFGSSNAQTDFGDSKEPVFVSAEKATYKGDTTILHKNVDVKQGTARIHADEMEIFREKRTPSEDSVDGVLSLGAVTRIVARGNFKYITPETVVSGERGTFFRNRGVIVVTGNVKVKQPNGSTLAGEKMVYDLKKKSVKFGEECKDGNCDDRVSVRLNNR